VCKQYKSVPVIFEPPCINCSTVDYFVCIKLKFFVQLTIITLHSGNCLTAINIHSVSEATSAHFFKQKVVMTAPAIHSLLPKMSQERPVATAF